MLEYKVLTQRDRLFSGSFDAEILQTTLNDHARDGWRVAEGFMVANPWKSLKTEILLVLERAAKSSS